MINDIRIVENYTMILESKIVVYGAGASGKKLIDFMHFLGCRVVNVCDSDEKKRGKKIYGIDICHVSDLAEIVDDNTIIVVASVYYDEIIKNVVDYVPADVVFTKFSFMLSAYLNYKKMNLAFPQLVEEYMEIWKKQELNNAQNVLKSYSVRKYMDLSENAVLIYQPGKTGSMTLYKSLEAMDVRTCHCHFLHEYSSDKEYLAWCEKVRKNYCGKIIVPVREPISRDISAYFQYLSTRLGAVIETYGVDDIYNGFIKMYYEPLKIKTDYDDRYLCKWINYAKDGYQFDFFHTELEKYFGINVFEYPFDTEKGYSVIKQGKLELMLVQAERMNELEDQIGAFLEIDQFQLKSVNVGDKKEYAYLYRNFKEKMKLPKGYIDFYYKDNQALKHFYSESQREVFYKKWSRDN